MATFTKVLINPARRQGRKYLSNPHMLHAAVMSAFPPDIDQSKERVLWRLDQRGHEHVLYIVGPEKPTAAHIVEEAGWDTRASMTADYDRFCSQLLRGQRWNFELVVNPTRTIRQDQGKRGRVVGLLSPDQQLNWLHQKAESMGVSFGPRDSSTARVIGKRTKNFQRPTNNVSHDPRRRGGDSVHLVTARFDGQLVVTDPEKLRSTLVKGVGRAKGYGCGLLTLARDKDAL